MSSEHQASALAEDVVGFPTALATSIGLFIVASVVLTTTQGFGLAGGTFVVTIVIAYGKLHRRQDEIGPPYCITVDPESLKNGAATIRATR